LGISTKLNEVMSKCIIPLHNWHSTIAAENPSNFPDLASIYPTPAFGPHVFLDCIQNHESEYEDKKFH